MTKSSSTRISRQTKIKEARAVLHDLGLPKSQQNGRTALCLLALLDLTPNAPWSEADGPRLGITPIMAWIRRHYAVVYAPNTRETIRRQSMHQFVQAGIAVYNPDNPSRPVNSPHAVYQVAPEVLAVLRVYNTSAYAAALREYLSVRETLAEAYAMRRTMVRVPLRLRDELQITVSSGDHSLLIKAVVEEFAERFVPGGRLVYVGDTGDKYGYFDAVLLAQLGVVLDTHGKLPDVVIYAEATNWLFLIEAATSHGPVDSKRHTELEQMLRTCKAGRVYVSAFPNRKVFTKYLECIALETEVWIADSPTHMIHFNGPRFLGPYGDVST